MKPDRYFKPIIVVLLLVLSALTASRLVRPPSTVLASGDKFQFAVGENQKFYLYDEGAGLVKMYGPDGKKELEIHLH